MAIAVAEGALDEVAEHRGGFRRRWYRTPAFVAGVLILVEALAAFDLETVRVSERDILWGAALELLE